MSQGRGLGRTGLRRHGEPYNFAVLRGRSEIKKLFFFLMSELQIRVGREMRNRKIKRAALNKKNIILL